MQHERLRPEEELEQDCDEHDREQKELEEEDEYQHRSVIQHSRAVDFWKHLREYDLVRMMNVVTRAVPRDLYAGLLHVHSRIWCWFKVAEAVMKLCIMGLNFIYITISFLEAWTHQTEFLLNMSNSQVVISKEGAVACVRTSSSNPKQCVHTNLHRYYQHLIMTSLEFFVVLPMTAAFLVFTVLFLCGGSYTKHLPSKRPWFFFFAPSAILSLSTLQFFQLWHPARIVSLWWLNEKKFWRLLFIFSVCGPDRKAADAPPSRESSRSTSRESGMAACRRGNPRQSSMPTSRESSMHEADAIGQGQQQAKEQRVRWKWFWNYVVINSVDWTLTEWILVLGFVNQVGTAINPNTIEVHRLLLFLFGGADGYWTRADCIKAHHFLSLAAHKICFGKIGDECRCCFKRAPVRLAPLAVMWTFASHDLQSLVFCPLREQRLEDGTALRARMLERVWEPSRCNTFLEQLKKAHHDDGPSKDCTQLIVKSEQERLSEIRDYLVGRVPIAGLDGPDEDQRTPGSVCLLVAAEIQNSIEDLDEIWHPTPPEKHHFIHKICDF